MSIIQRFSVSVFRRNTLLTNNNVGGAVRGHIAWMPRTQSVSPVSGLQRRLMSTSARDDLGTKLERIKEEGLSQDNLIEFLQACRNKYDFEIAQKALQSARDAKLPITADIYAHVLLSGCQGLKYSEIRELFGEKIETGTASDAVHSDCYPMVKMILESMEGVGLELPMWFYEVIVTRMAGAEQAGVIVNLIVAMEKRGVTPSIGIYNKALYLLPRKGLSDRAESLFRKLVVRDLATYTTYTTWMSTLVASERFSDAEKIFREAGKKFPLDNIAYNILINCRLRAGKVEEGLDIFDKMRIGNFPDVKPDRYTVSTLIDYMMATGDISQAQRVFPFVADCGFPGSSHDYALLLRFYARYDDTQFNNLLKMLVSEDKKDVRDVWFYNALLRILVDKQVLAESKRNIGDILSATATLPSNHPPTELQQACATAPISCRSIVDRLVLENVRPDEFTYEAIMRSLSHRNLDDAVGKVYELVTKSRSRPSYTAHNLYLSSLLNQRNMAEAEKLLQTMRLGKIPVYPRNVNLCRDFNVKLPDGVLTAQGRAVRSPDGINAITSPSTMPEFSSI